MAVNYKFILKKICISLASIVGFLALCSVVFVLGFLVGVIFVSTQYNSAYCYPPNSPPKYFETIYRQ